MKNAPHHLSLRSKSKQALFKKLEHDTFFFNMPCYGFIESPAPVTHENPEEGTLENALLLMKLESQTARDWQDFLVSHAFAFIGTELHLAGNFTNTLHTSSPLEIEFSSKKEYAQELSADLFTTIPSRFSLDGMIGETLSSGFWAKYLVDILHANRGWAIFPLVDNIPIGFCLFSNSKEILDINLIALDMKYRGRGIATRIIQHAAEQTGLGRLRTEVYAGNNSALSFYLRNGLTAVENTYHVFHSWPQRRAEK